MQFGMPTLIECASLKENIALCRETGLSFLELNQNLPDYQNDRLCRALDEVPNDLFCTLHLDENLNPLDFNPSVAQAWRDTALTAAKIARERGLPVLNLHFPMGVYFTLPDGKRYLYDQYWNEVRKRLIDFRDQMADRAGSTLVCVENTEFSRLSHLEEALSLLLESPSFALTYDCGHDYTDGQRAKPFYADHAECVRHLHLHGATLASCHLPLDEGDLDVLSHLRETGAERAFLEVKTAEGLRQSVRYLKRKGIIHD